WNNQLQKLQDWTSEKRARNEWKNVLYLDGVQIEDWLNQCPAVSARYAPYELRLAPQLRESSISEFWDEYSTTFQPPLAGSVLLCGRERQSKELVEKLLGSPGKIVLKADSPDEVVAFAVAAIRTADEGINSFLDARTLIVDTEDAAQIMGARNGLVFLTRANG